MDLTIPPIAQFLAAAALVLGLVLGFVVRGGLARKLAVMTERAEALSRERDTLVQERERLTVEIKARDAQIRPLADEVDKLRRDFARAQARLNDGAQARLNDGAQARLNDGAQARLNDGAQARLSGDAPTVETRSVDPGDLSQLKGIGPKFADKLRAAGITAIDQIAGWTAVDAQVIDSQMGDFAGRIASDRLVEQAQLISQGRYTEYETLFGKLAAR
ncbi:hypothetical protein [Sandarakinorhabdus sp.]|uniref:hypothetical protein n=1 Tax=Sandarakinorhabdus sp. TaxID=1916663 RepID=UPI00286E47EA|nr:hypothetical protein [Sandarakinorhabdus sp.]